MADEIRGGPLVSVVMSFHNAQATLLHSIRSVIWQTYQNWELILLDDGSTDASVEVSETVNDPRIRLYGGGACRGLSARLNQGVLLTKGQYIARMDADDIAFPERFAKQVAYLQTHAEIDLLASSVLLMNKNPKMKVEISGHTDSKGSDAYNQKLSEERAEAIVNNLKTNGIDANRMKAKGFGKTLPAAPNKNLNGSDNPEGRQLNRRVELRVTEIN